MAAAVSKLDALLHFNLAPLRLRRDIAMLGLIHRSVLGIGPPHIRKFFKRSNSGASAGRHRWQLKELEADSTDYELPGSSPANYLGRSALGLVSIYIRLPNRIVEQTIVKGFQSALQSWARALAAS